MPLSHVPSAPATCPPARYLHTLLHAPAALRPSDADASCGLRNPRGACTAIAYTMGSLPSGAPTFLGDLLADVLPLSLSAGVTVMYVVNRAAGFVTAVVVRWSPLDLRQT